MNLQLASWKHRNHGVILSRGIERRTAKKPFLEPLRSQVLGDMCNLPLLPNGREFVPSAATPSVTINMGSNRPVLEG